MSSGSLFLHSSYKLFQKIKSYLERFPRFWLTISLLACVLLPDFIINHLTGSGRVFWNWIAFLFLSFLCYSLTFLKTRPFLIIWSLLGLLETIQFSHIVYFGVPISPNALLMLFYERHDIFDLTYLNRVWFVYPVIGLLYGTGFFLFTRTSPALKKKRPFLSLLCVFYALSLLLTDGVTLTPKRLKRFISSEPTWILRRYYMRTPAPSLKASLLACGSAASQYFVTKAALPKLYKPYALKKCPSAVKNVVLIMGESVNCDRLSLFGYTRETTPHLTAQRHNPFFFYKPAYAAAPNTYTSIALFFNLVREHDNMSVMQSNVHNLFQRARENGFKTFLITNNNGSRSMGGAVDVVYTSLFLDTFPHATYPDVLRKKKDRALAFLLKELPLGEKNFIVLHMWAPHSPYPRSYQADKQFCRFPETGSFHEDLVNTYDNCLLYVDKVWHEITTAFQETFQKRGDSYLFFTADHGELFGEEAEETGAKRYGHYHFTLSGVRVPFWLLALQPPMPELKAVLESSLPLSYYDIGKMLLACFGEKLHNPQEDPRIGQMSDSLEGPTLTYQKMPGGTAQLIAAATAPF